MTYSSFFEIGGDLIELKADFDYAVGEISASKRKQQKTISKDMKSIGKVTRGKSTSDDGWGPGEKIGYGLGVGAGALFAIGTFPVVVADSPMIGPADLAWFAASARFMTKSTTIGRKVGRTADKMVGWD